MVCQEQGLPHKIFEPGKAEHVERTDDGQAWTKGSCDTEWGHKKAVDEPRHVTNRPLVRKTHWLVIVVLGGAEKIMSDRQDSNRLLPSRHILSCFSISWVRTGSCIPAQKCNDRCLLEGREKISKYEKLFSRLLPCLVHQSAVCVQKWPLRLVRSLLPSSRIPFFVPCS